MYKILMNLALALILTMCGDAKEEAEKEQKEENLEKTIEVTLLGKKLRVEDSLFSLSCNQFYFEYMMTSANPSCVAVIADVDISFSWTVTSADESIKIEGHEDKDNATLTIEGVKYYCYLYGDSVYKSDGEMEAFGSHVLLTKGVATKYSEVKSNDVYGIATSNEELCNTFY